MSTLITGIGLVGTSFAQFALNRAEEIVFFDVEPRNEFLRAKFGDRKVSVVQKDIRDLPALIQTMTEYKIDTVVHSAGLIGAKVAESFYAGLQINVLGTINVAEAARLTGVKRLIHISTYGVYDHSREMSTPITEDCPRGGDGGPYNASEVARELILESYQSLYGFDLVILRAANTFGLGHFWAGSGAGQKFQLLLESGIRGQVAKIPKQRTGDFEYIYAKDLGRAVDLAATCPLPSKAVINIGSETITKFAEVLAIAKRLIPSLQVEIISAGKTHESMKQPLAIARAKLLLGWAPRFSMESALEDYIEDLRTSIGIQATKDFIQT